MANRGRNRGMTHAALYRLGWIAALALGACAAPAQKPDAAPGKVTAQMRSGATELRAYQVMDWIAPDDRTLIVNAADRSLYEGRFRSTCAGLRLANSIAFIIPAGAQLSNYSGVVLPDGTRCLFASFTRLPTSPAAAKGHAEGP